VRTSLPTTQRSGPRRSLRGAGLLARWRGHVDCGQLRSNAADCRRRDRHAGAAQAQHAPAMRLEFGEAATGLLDRNVADIAEVGAFPVDDLQADQVAQGPQEVSLGTRGVL
jgi:hypothetical protein